MSRTAEDIRNDIKRLAVEYCSLTEPRRRRTGYVPVSGKELGEEELCAMMDASLDMWLTAGRFNDAFEKTFAERLGATYALTVNSGSSANLLAMTGSSTCWYGRVEKG